MVASLIFRSFLLCRYSVAPNSFCISLSENNRSCHSTGCLIYFFKWLPLYTLKNDLSSTLTLLFPPGCLNWKYYSQLQGRTQTQFSTRFLSLCLKAQPKGISFSLKVASTSVFTGMYLFQQYTVSMCLGLTGFAWKLFPSQPGRVWIFLCYSCFQGQWVS